MQVYFIDNDDYFQNRLQVTDENGEEYENNDARQNLSKKFILIVTFQAEKNYL